MNLNINLCKFISPFSMIISGPSSSGKTFWVRNLLKYHSLLIQPPKENITVFWAYGIYQSLYDEKIPNVEIIYSNGFPTETEIDNLCPDLIILDDLMNEVSDEQ
ncbi:MAG: hypothetical protein QM535_21175, partial [Limnohabitans sp.]|nr:hypothetical protein [Limnohabitans sp.]